MENLEKHVALGPSEANRSFYKRFDEKQESRSAVNDVLRRRRSESVVFTSDSHPKVTKAVKRTLHALQIGWKTM